MSAAPARRSEGAAEPGLKGSLGLLDLAMLGAGAAMGVSIFSVLSPASQVAGTGMLAAVFLAAAPMAVFALVYGYMASVLPKSGASYEWPRRLISPFAGFMVAWLRIVGSVGAMVTLALVLARHLGTVLPLAGGKPFMLGVLALVFAVNYRGVQIAARAQTVAMLALLTAFALFVASAAPSVELARIADPFASGPAAVLRAVPLMIPLFLGIETSVEVGEEVRDARRTVPRALGLALGLTVVVYLAVAATALGVLGSASLAESKAPLVDASAHALAGLGPPLMLAAAVLALMKSLNALFIVFSRYLFAMARSGVLPAALARIHPRYGTPHAACTTAFLLTAAGLALPGDLVFLFVAISIPTVLKYLSTCVSAWRLVLHRPDLASQAQMGFGRSTVIALAASGSACAIVLFALGFTTDWKPFVLIGAWGGLGMIYWFIAGARRVQKADRNN